MQLQRELKEIIRSTPGNELCVDCREPNPTWASVNLGVFMCLACSGIHRSLGVHISFVKSLSLDAWTPQLVSNMRAGGNNRANAFFEATLPTNYARPSNSQARDQFIRDKYESRKWASAEKAANASNRTQAPLPEENATLGRKKRLTPAERRRLQAEQNVPKEAPPTPPTSNVEDKVQEQSLLDTFSDPLTTTGSTSPNLEMVSNSPNALGSMFKNMSIKVAGSLQSTPEVVSDSTSQVEQKQMASDLLSFDNSPAAPSAQVDMLPQTGALSNGEAPTLASGSTSGLSSSALSFIQEGGPSHEAPAEASTSILDQFRTLSSTAVSNGEPSEMFDSSQAQGGSVDYFADLGAHEAAALAPSQAQSTESTTNVAETKSPVHEDLGQIDFELDQIECELEQAKLNVQAFNEAKAVLLATKERLVQLSGHVEHVQSDRLAFAGQQTLQPKALKQQQGLVEKANALRDSLAKIGSDLSREIL